MQAHGTTHFWSRVARSNSESCWEWQGGKTPDGYGKAGHKHRNYLAHRLAWELTFGPIPEGLQVLHRCDNPPCCNPAHLFLGTHADNMRDMAAKSRRDSHGEKNNRAKLTVKQVLEIRERYIPDGSRNSVLAAEYGVCAATIGNVGKRETWRSVP